MRQKYSVIGGIIAAAAVAVAGLYYYFNADGESTSDTVQAASSHALIGRSDAYHFGFVHAALAGCRFAPGDTLDDFTASVKVQGQGLVPDDLKAGFAEFQRLQNASGATRVCSLAEDLFGPRGHLRPGVLMRP